MGGISFEWDSKKAIINADKHGVTFEEATTVFADEEAILFDDPEHSGNEERFLLLGLSSNGRTLIVCHCYRCNDDIIRLISARKATKKESAVYLRRKSEND